MVGGGRRHDGNEFRREVGLDDPKLGASRGARNVQLVRGRSEAASARTA